MVEKNDCGNCKFVKREMYGDNRCGRTFSLERYDRTISKVYSLTSKIRNDVINCEDYKPNIIMKIRLRIGYIQGWWYSRKYPEKMV